MPNVFPCWLPHSNLLYIKRSTEYTQHGLPERPRRGGSVATKFFNWGLFFIDEVGISFSILDIFPESLHAAAFECVGRQ